MSRTRIALLGVALALTGSARADEDIRKLPIDFLHDQKAIWTSPLHMNGNSAKWWIAMGIATAALVATDNHTINTFENAPTQVRWGNHVSNVGSVFTVVPIAVGFYTAGALAKNSKARETGVLSGEALLDGLMLQVVLKSISGRDRPYVAHGHQKWFDGGASFPSGHAIAAWSIASVIAREYAHKKWVPVVAYSLATVVGAARFTGQQHYASDVFAGGVMGWFVGRYVFQVHHRDKTD
jgi:membrane-associated phospholipid phosphatase